MGDTTDEERNAILYRAVRVIRRLSYLLSRGSADTRNHPRVERIAQAVALSALAETRQRVLDAGDQALALELARALRPPTRTPT